MYETQRGDRVSGGSADDIARRPEPAALNEKALREAFGCSPAG
ncbi:hypothetical protein ACFY1L_49950 [Streptomyces sp. NPDC001663]